MSSYSAEGDLARAAHDRHIVVAIDGPAGSGKSTVGSGLAQILRCPYIDTGLMYRAVTLAALRRGLPLADGDLLGNLASGISFDVDSTSLSLLIDGERPDPALRSPQVDNAVSAVSAHRSVRERMVERQRRLASSRCAVMVGRDIGTVVLPEAPVKLWVTASPEERARRRLAERLPGAERLDYAEAVRSIESRDAQDSGRAVSPLRRAPDSIDIDTEHLTPEGALDVACDAVRLALSRAVAGS